MQTPFPSDKIVSMDGNFRLVRKKSSGVSHRPPLHTGHFFVADDVVAPYVKEQAVDQVP
jgi:hypothetical protein